jgi:hypothetical protein
MPDQIMKTYKLELERAARRLVEAQAREAIASQRKALALLKMLSPDTSAKPGVEEGGEE